MAEREDDGQPKLRAALGTAAKLLREARGLSQRELAALVPCDRAYISRVEKGDQLPSDALTEKLDALLKASGLLTELLEAARVGSIQVYGQSGVEKEAKADRIQLFTSSTIPGLLQTPDYARALFKAFLPRASEKQIEEAVADRLKRQQVLKRPEPPLFWAILDEAAIRRRVGGKECMRNQLTHLLDFTDSADVTVQVHPFDAEEHSFMGGSLSLLTTEGGETVAYLESYGSGELVESPKQVLRWTQLFDIERSRALTKGESLEVIRGYVKEFK